MTKKIAYLCAGLLTIFITSSVFGEIQQGDVDVELEVPQIIKLELLTSNIKVIPGPEDYARNLTTSEFEGGNEAVDPGKGFADRSSAIELTMFTNAQRGGLLFVYGMQPPEQQGILRLEDTYLSVQTDKTFILQNNIEGATTKFKTYQDKSTYWLRLHNEAQEIFKVTIATKDSRLIVFKIGIGNLAGYTYGNYKNTITFSLIPLVI
ncbi:MAG: hypothetical protein AB1567_08535 [bacterium]